MSSEGLSALIWNAERLRIATDAAGIALWSWNVDTDEIAMDDRAHGLWGVARSGPVTFETLSKRIHPEDLHRVRNAFEATRSTLGPYEIDFRTMHGDDVRWISARGMGDGVGMVDRVMFGAFLDVTKRKQAEEAREMLVGEMSHRVKNLFAITSALTDIASRSASTTAGMARDMRQRLSGLGRAHDLIRPVVGSDHGRAASLGNILSVLLAPYDDNDPEGARVHVSVPEVPVGEASATTLALVVHELATNSIKYGALSDASGSLDVSGTADDREVVVVWSERGGPPVTSEVTPGFGSKLITQSMSGQLGGIVLFEWLSEGLVATLKMQSARLAS